MKLNDRKKIDKNREEFKEGKGGIFLVVKNMYPWFLFHVSFLFFYLLGWNMRPSGS